MQTRSLRRRAVSCNATGAAGVTAVLAMSVLLGAGCSGLEPKSHVANPLGWPAKILSVGHEAADSAIPLYRELGRTATAIADLLESPALLVEGVLTLDGEGLIGSAEKLVVGSGGAVTSFINIPFFPVTGGSIDIGREAGTVNEALAHMESVDPAVWRTGEGDDRGYVYAPGTRVSTSGRNLIWHLPGEGDVIQAAEVSPTLALSLDVTGMAHVAQARTWGFVVGSQQKWNSCDEKLRAVIIVHEFFHQHVQIRQGFRSWSIFYWPAYVLGMIGDDSDHWAETGSPDGAYVVNRTLVGWRRPGHQDSDPPADWIDADDGPPALRAPR